MPVLPLVPVLLEGRLLPGLVVGQFIGPANVPVQEVREDSTEAAVGAISPILRARLVPHQATLFPALPTTLSRPPSYESDDLQRTYGHPPGGGVPSYYLALGIPEGALHLFGVNNPGVGGDRDPGCIREIVFGRGRRGEVPSWGFAGEGSSGPGSDLRGMTYRRAHLQRPHRWDVAG